jgi:hypothetical protein
MNPSDQLVDGDVEVARREFDDRTEFVADFGPGREASVDVLGDTVIVVADDDQYELETDGDAEAFIRNGILTIEVNE